MTALAGLYLRPGIYFLNLLETPQLIIETGLYLHMAFIQGYTLYYWIAFIDIPRCFDDRRKKVTLLLHLFMYTDKS